MPRTLLVAHPAYTWREWIKEQGGGADVLVLDPASCEHGPPGRISVRSGEKLHDWRFVGTLDPQRNPAALLSGLAELLPGLSNNVIALLFDWHPFPLLRQMGLMVARILTPERILVPEGTGLEKEGWSVGAEVVAIPTGFPRLVQQAQQRARWIELAERSERHIVSLGSVAVEGARMGSGVKIKNLPSGDYAEVAGGVLHLVTSRDLAPDEVSRTLDIAHATRLSLVDPDAYRGLLCAFSRQNGEDFGMGVIESFDPLTESFTILAEAVSPAPVRILKLGTLKILADGKESVELKPWTV